MAERAISTFIELDVHAPVQVLDALRDAGLHLSLVGLQRDLSAINILKYLIVVGILECVHVCDNGVEA